jgi:hypothetical protein
MDYGILKFPRQKLPLREKGEKWFKECIEAAEKLTFYDSESSLREPLEDRIANEELYNGILNPDDIERVANPWGLNKKDFPEQMRHYPIANSKINVLVGEESKKRFDFRVMVTNDSAVSEKEKWIKESILAQLGAMMNPNETPDLPEEKIQGKIKDLDRWRKFEAQDMRERRASQILAHDSKEQKFDFNFSRGFKKALIKGEEIYCVDIYGEKPVLRLCNSDNVFFTGTGDSIYIEDADVIVEINYLSIGQVIDKYYDWLSGKDVEKLENRGKERGGSGNALNYDESEIINFPARYFEGDLTSKKFPSSPYNEEGMVRELRAVWKSRRQLGELTYYDEETGRKLTKIVDENYIPDIDKGEVVTWMWVNEWMEGTKLGKDTFVKMRPRPVQFRRMDNLSICGSGYVGTLYGKSLMSNMKPYNYWYDAIAFKLDKEIAKYKGPVLEIDLAKVPDGWTPEQYLFYITEGGFMVIDSFKEGDKGNALGKLAGNYNTTGNVYNSDMGNFIMHNVQMLKYIEEELGNAVGITRQREGQTFNSETVGGIERSVLQSTSITEEYFMLHEDTKLRVMETYLETAKYAYRNKTDKVQYILDDLSSAIYGFDDINIVDADFGIVPANTKAANEFFSAIKQLAQAGIQNDKLNFSNFMDIYLSQSLAESRRKIETFEEDKLEEIRRAREEDAKSQQESLKMVEEGKQKDRDLKKYEIDVKREIELAKLNQPVEQTEEVDNTDFENEAKEKKLALDEEKVNLDKQKAEDDKLLAEKQLQETIRHNKAMEKKTVKSNK